MSINFGLRSYLSNTLSAGFNLSICPTWIINFFFFASSINLSACMVVSVIGFSIKTLQSKLDKYFGDGQG